MKDQESNPRPRTPRPAALPMKVVQWVRNRHLALCQYLRRKREKLAGGCEAIVTAQAPPRWLVCRSYDHAPVQASTIPAESPQVSLLARLSCLYESITDDLASVSSCPRHDKLLHKGLPPPPLSPNGRKISAIPVSECSGERKLPDKKSRLVLLGMTQPEGGGLVLQDEQYLAPHDLQQPQGSRKGCRLPRSACIVDERGLTFRPKACHGSANS